VTELREIASGVRDSSLRSILRAVFSDEVFFERFTACPGSQSRHHAYRTGLLEHTVSVAGLCQTLAARYPGCDGDLLVCAALLHDIGKVFELEHSSAIEYTDTGRLLGHVVLGDRYLNEVIARTGLKVADELLARLSHAILSHHGELEWGSPKRPSTVEALLLHHVDNLDAKASGFLEIASGAVALDERWTDAQNLFRRPLFAPAPLEDERPHSVHEDDQYRVATA
jgi:3'-5' exoribonuclease